MSKIFIGSKKTCLGILDREERDKYNETCLKEGGGIEMSTTVLHSRAAPSLEYLPALKTNAKDHDTNILPIHYHFHPTNKPS